MAEESRIAGLISYKDFLTGGPKKHGDTPSYQLQIPVFQRNYSWDSKHIRELIETIRDDDRSVYIGNIIIEKSRGTSGKDLVIDGQQRLITLSLIAKALESRLSEQLSEIHSILFFAASNADEFPDLRISFMRENQQEVYESIMNDVVMDGKDFDKLQKKLLSNFETIKKEITQLVDPEKFFENMKACEFVVIKFPEKDTYQLFEGLNSKGKGLSPIELTKTILFNEALRNLSHEEVEKINKEWEETERRFEKENLSWFGKFLRHQRFAFDKNISNSGIVSRIRKEIKKDRKALIDFQKAIITDADIYLKLRTATLRVEDLKKSMHRDSWNKISYLLDYILWLDLDQVYAVLLALVKHGKQNKTYFGSEMASDIEKLWGFLFLVRYSNTSPSKYEKMFARFVYAILNTKELEKYGGYRKCKDLFFEDLKKLIPSENVFVASLVERVSCTGENEAKVTDRNNRNHIKLMLLTYLVDQSALFKVEDGTIEHIIPKGKKEGLRYWKISPAKIDYIKKTARYKIGNLTILEDDSLGNESFIEKDKIYVKSKFLKNKRLGHEFGKLFNSKDPSIAVKNRGIEIAKYLYGKYSKSF
jgi:uncharacterized protein with ParB-like and HNH nuclease domain